MTLAALQGRYLHRSGKILNNLSSELDANSFSFEHHTCKSLGQLLVNNRFIMKRNSCVSLMIFCLMETQGSSREILQRSELLLLPKENIHMRSFLLKSKDLNVLPSTEWGD